MKKIPMRTCVISHEKLPKKDLLRIVSTSDGIIVDETGKVNGHGVYIKKDKDVLEKAKKNKILDRVFNFNISDSLYDEIEKIINK